VAEYVKRTVGRQLDALPPKEQRILEAAQRILDRDGFTALSFDAIAAEADVYKQAIQYYFGNKEGLVEALVDVATHDVSLRVYSRSAEQMGLEARLRTVVNESRSLPMSEGYRAIWELLPHMLRSEGLRDAVAALYDAFRHHYDQVFEASGTPVDPETARDYASIMLAVIDGIAMQKALDPKGVDVDRIFALWARIAAGSVAQIEGDAEAQVAGERFS
jgi:AcrR family transcriptional regulator